MPPTKVALASLLTDTTMASASGSLTVNLPRPGEVQASAYACSTAMDSDVAVPETGCQRPEPSECSDNPIRFWDGNARYDDAEPLPRVGSVALNRSYDSTNAATGLFGVGWSSVLESVLTQYNNGLYNLVLIQLPEGRRVAFAALNGAYEQVAPEAKQTPDLFTTETGLFVYRAGGSRIAYAYSSSTGKLMEVRNLAANQTTSLSYSTNSISVTDNFSNAAWSVALSGGLVESISVPTRSDIKWLYCYGDTVATASHLTSVRFGASATCASSDTSPRWRSYTYDTTTYSRPLLSEARDVSSNLIEAHTYDGIGRAASESRPQMDISSISYGVTGDSSDDTVTQLTYASGSVQKFHVQWIGSRPRTVRTEGDGCASCGGKASVFSTDSLGRISRLQDEHGYITEFGYGSNGLLTTRTDHRRPSSCNPATSSCVFTTSAALAAATLTDTSATVTHSFSYANSAWPEIVTTTSRPSVLQSTGSTSNTLTLDTATGEVLTSTSSGWSGSVASPASQTRTVTRVLYNGTESAAFNPLSSGQPSWYALAQPSGRSKSVDGPRSDVSDATQFVYYPNDATTVTNAPDRGRLAATKNAAGHITRYENYDVFGNAQKVTDPNGVVTEMTFDALGRVLTRTIKGVSGCDTTADALCATDLVSSRAYASTVGALESETNAAAGYTLYAYDSRGRVANVKRGPSSSSLLEQIESTYDSATGKKSQERVLAYESSTWAEKKITKYEYDSEGRLYRTFYPPFSTPLTDGDHEKIIYGAGNLVNETKDARHSQVNTKYTYDAAGRLETTQQLLDVSANSWITTSYSYDTAGNLTGVTDPNGNVTTYRSDDFGATLKVTSPVTGTTTNQYDAAGNLTATTDARGATTSRTYDALNRVLTATSVLSSSEQVSWEYDTAASDAFRTGRLKSMTDPFGTTTYAYDRRGLLRSESRGSDVTAYGYDANGSRSLVKYPSTLTASYTLDAFGRPTALTAKYGTNSPQTLISSASWMPFGPLKTLAFSNETRTVTYDERYRMLTNVLAAGATTIASYSYTSYDGAGNVTAIADTLNSGYNRAFGYDSLGRLTSANTGSSLWGGSGYTYDNMGNVTSGLGSRSFSYASTTPIMSELDWGRDVYPTILTHDAAGNLATTTREMDGIVSTTVNEEFSYSPRNHYVGYTSWTQNGPEIDLGSGSSWSYDGRGVRIASDGMEIGVTTAYTYSPELQLLSRKRYGVAADDILWFSGQPVAQWSNGGTLRYTFTDHLGTPILQTNSATTPTVLWRAEYEPFGNVYSYRAGAADDQPLRLPGQEYSRTTEAGDEENYNIFRWYRSGWGRYTQADPLAVGGLGVFAHGRMTRYEVPRIHKSQDHDNAVKEWGVGIYSYAADNPIVVSDPVGLKALRCRVFTLISSPSQKLRGKCVMLGECESIFNPYDKYVTFGTIYIPSCFSCPKKCTFEAHGDGSVWMDPSTDEWDCTPWTPIYRSQEGPLDGQL
jgi:RHS repeat-associated protein